MNYFSILDWYDPAYSCLTYLYLTLSFNLILLLKTSSPGLGWWWYLRISYALCHRSSLSGGGDEKGKAGHQPPIAVGSTWGPLHMRYERVTNHTSILSGVIKHGWLENPLWMEVLWRKSLINGPFSITMFDYRRVWSRLILIAGWVCFQYPVNPMSMIEVWMVSGSSRCEGMIDITGFVMVWKIGYHPRSYALSLFSY